MLSENSLGTVSAVSQVGNWKLAFQKILSESFERKGYGLYEIFFAKPFYFQKELF